LLLAPARARGKFRTYEIFPWESSYSASGPAAHRGTAGPGRRPEAKRSLDSGRRPKGGAQVATKPPLQRQPRADRAAGGQSRVVFGSTSGTFAAPGGAAGQRRAVEREIRKGRAV